MRTPFACEALLRNYRSRGTSDNARHFLNHANRRALFISYAGACDTSSRLRIHALYGSMTYFRSSSGALIDKPMDGIVGSLAAGVYPVAWSAASGDLGGRRSSVEPG